MVHEHKSISSLQQDAPMFSRYCSMLDPDIHKGYQLCESVLDITLRIVKMFIDSRKESQTNELSRDVCRT